MHGRRTCFGQIPGACLLVLLALGVALSGTVLAQEQSSSPRSPQPDFSPQWEPAFQGIDLMEARVEVPPLAVFGARIDLGDDGISFLVTPSNGAEDLDVNGSKVSAFLLRHALQLAINASPFSPVDNTPGAPKNVCGLSVSRGDAYSRPEGHYACLLLSKANRAWIEAPPKDLSEVYNGAAGFEMLVIDGAAVGKRKGLLQPRTAIGISKDGRYLYFLIIDGRNRTHSVGTTLYETGQWMAALGAHEALNMDGGGSACMVVADARQGARILNQPIHARIPGNERVVGNCLGVYAKPLGKPQ